MTHASVVFGSPMRIVITGMGVVSPVGSGLEAFWDSLCKGASGIGEITRFDTDGFKLTRAGEVKGFRLPDGLPAHLANRDIALQFMAAAAEQAVKDSGLSEATVSSTDVGVVLSTNFGAAGSVEQFLASPDDEGTAHGGDAMQQSFQSCADIVADIWQFAGPRSVLSLSCASGTAALAYGADLIRSGRAQAIVTGGFDGLSKYAWSGLSALRTMTKDEIRPFDKRRAGTIFSEGAGALVVEELEHARARGAKILAEVVGWGTNNNAFHLTAPSKQGAGSAEVMRMALSCSGINADEIDHVNAHGTGTAHNDVTETEAIKSVFGDHAGHMPITAIKSMTGHMMGAAGSVEAIAAIMSIRNGVIPPTINYGEPDPACDLDYVTNAKREASVRTALSNSAGIGGCNAAVIFRKM